MDIIILGLLMMKGFTIYEIRQFIGLYLTSISSNSTGSIQAAIKKLLKKEMITFREQVENGVNKKTYFITDDGKTHFTENLSVPMSYKEKNMELNKLFFMGFLDKKQQITSIRNYIQELQKELEYLEQINASLNPRYGFDQAYIDNLKQNGVASELAVKEKVQDIALFQYAMLDFGIDKLRFEIEWFSGLKDKLEMEAVKNEGK